MRREGHIKSGSWQDRAREEIAALSAILPDDLDFKARKKALRDAYPWGVRKHWPYKMWLKQRKIYLDQFDPANPQMDLFRDYLRAQQIFEQSQRMEGRLQ